MRQKINELLKVTIVNEDDVQLYDEVISCYKNGLYRSGYLLAWILLIESLKRKIIQLADLEDARGKEQWKKIEKLEEQHQSTDIQIILSAKECEIISDTEYTTVNSLWQQRCIFAHPYMEEVKSSDLEYIMSKMIDITLSKALYYGKKNIEDNLEELRKHPHIIPTNGEEQKLFINNQLVRTRERHYPFLYKTLFYYFSKSVENKDKRLSVFFHHYITKLILHPNIDINDSKYTIEKQLSDFPQICWLLFNMPETWNKLNNKFQGDLFRFIEITPTQNSVSFIVQAFRLISKIQIPDEFLAIYYKKLQVFPISRVHQLYVDKTILLNKIWDENIKEGKFYKQMEYIDFLDSFNTPISDTFNETESEKLGYFLGLCCNNNTFTAQNFTNKCSSLWINNIPFCNGLIHGMMTKGENLFIYRTSFPCVLSVMAKLENDNLFAILDDLEKLKPSTDEFMYDIIQRIYENKKGFIVSEDARIRLNNIIESFLQ